MEHVKDPEKVQYMLEINELRAFKTKIRNIMEDSTTDEMDKLDSIDKLLKS